MLRALALLLTLAFALGCGEEDGDAASSSRAPEPPPGEWAADVRVTFDRDGDGGADARTVRLQCPSERRATACRRLRALSPAAFLPKPASVACTELYGGPQTGRIRGTVGGRRVDGRYERTDGCEIGRFDRVRPVLRVAR